MGRPPKCACQCNYVLYSSDVGHLDSDTDWTVRFQSCDLQRKKSGHGFHLCTDIDAKGFEYHAGENLNSAIVQKRNASGNLVWEYVGTTDISTMWVSVDRSDNVYGTEYGFVPNPSNPFNEIETSTVFLLDSSGTKTWENSYTEDAGGIPGFGSVKVLRIRKIGCGLDGAVATGNAEGHIGTTPECGIAIYYDTAGNQQWQVLASDYATYGTNPGEIQSSQFGRPEFTINGDVYFGMDSVTPSVSAPAWDTLFRFDSSGNLIWKKQLGYSVYGLCLDQEENLYVVYRTAVSGFARLTKFARGDQNEQQWDVPIDSLDGSLVAEFEEIAIACDGKNPACLYTSVYRGTGPDPDDRNKAERYNSTDGTLEERIDLLNTAENVVASPGRHPNFF